MVRGGTGIDWGCAEMLAFGTLLLEGTNVRLTGQDSGRGTFSHRHAVLLRPQHRRALRAARSTSPTSRAGSWSSTRMLSEAAVLGFEYGFSSADPRNLVVWEAQFGDFANGAQVIIDQFISSAESKWQRMSGLVLLLPHGYEGQGPEHSSARLERFLQLCAENNMQVCNLTTPAQYFHALRRQMHRTFRKPLVLMSPKSLLRHKLAVSPLGDLRRRHVPARASPRPTALDAARVRRVLLCSGKVYYDLLDRRASSATSTTSPSSASSSSTPSPPTRSPMRWGRITAATEVFWVQEEPWNMGAWHFMALRLPQLARRAHACATSAARRRPARPPGRTRCTSASRPSWSTARSRKPHGR